MAMDLHVTGEFYNVGECQADPEEKCYFEGFLLLPPLLLLLFVLLLSQFPLFCSFKDLPSLLPTFPTRSSPNSSLQGVAMAKLNAQLPVLATSTEPTMQRYAVRQPKVQQVGGAWGQSCCLGLGMVLNVSKNRANIGPKMSWNSTNIRQEHPGTWLIHHQEYETLVVPWCSRDLSLWLQDIVCSLQPSCHSWGRLLPAGHRALSGGEPY